jgi:[protein-PII] uridylyltransferase
VPDRYSIVFSTQQIVGHVDLVRRRTGRCALETPRAQRGDSHVELVMVADDVPGLLAKVTGVLFANKLDVMEAAIYSREPEGETGRAEALDVFRVRLATPGATFDAQRVAKIRDDLEAVLSGDVPVVKLVASRAAASGSIYARAKPEVPPTEVSIDNDVSSDFTVVDVFAEDKPGVLYAIARILHEQGLDIHRSKVGVEADRVADIFYVRDDRTAGKIVAVDKLDAIRRALVDGLSAPQKRTAAVG